MDGKLMALSPTRWQYKRNKRETYYIHVSRHMDDTMVVSNPKGEEHLIIADDIAVVCDLIDANVCV